MYKDKQSCNQSCNVATEFYYVAVDSSIEMLVFRTQQISSMKDGGRSRKGEMKLR